MLVVEKDVFCLYKGKYTGQSIEKTNSWGKGFASPTPWRIFAAAEHGGSRSGVRIQICK